MKIVERIEGMTGKFNNQTIIITRGAIGIGESMAIEFSNLL
jgi:short-subunit dehydrogenase involved in D-alanine esterification of teichoic acids